MGCPVFNSPSNMSTMRKKASEKEDFPLPVRPQIPIWNGEVACCCGHWEWPPLPALGVHVSHSFSHPAALWPGWAVGWVCVLFWVQRGLVGAKSNEQNQMHKLQYHMAFLM